MVDSLLLGDVRVPITTTGTHRLEVWLDPGQDNTYGFLHDTAYGFNLFRAA